MEERKQARISIDREVEVSRVDERIFSSFIEHLGRAVYEGIYQPGSKFADEDGLRKDTISLIRELKVPYVRIRVEILSRGSSGRILSARSASGRTGLTRRGV